MITVGQYYYSPETADVTVYERDYKFLPFPREYAQDDLVEVATWAMSVGLGYMWADTWIGGEKKLCLFGKNAKELYLLRWA